MKRMENKLEEEVINTQAGFRKNRGTRDHIFNLKMIIQKYREVHTRDVSCLKKLSVVEINLSMPVGLQTSL